MRKNEKGSIELIAIGLLVVSLICAVGYIGWQKLSEDKSGQTPVGQRVSKESEKSDEKKPVFCARGEDTKATSGVFCSEDFGFKFLIPSGLKGKLSDKEKIEREKFVGTYTNGKWQNDTKIEKISAIRSYSTTHSEDTVKWTFDISEYPREAVIVRSWGQAGYNLERNIFVNYQSRSTGPTHTYDSATDTMREATPRVDFAPEKLSQVENVVIAGIPVYYAGIGDAGVQVSSIMFIRDSRVFIIGIDGNALPGPRLEKSPTYNNYQAINDEFNGFIKRKIDTSGNREGLEGISGLSFR